MIRRSSIQVHQHGPNGPENGEQADRLNLTEGQARTPLASFHGLQANHCWAAGQGKDIGGLRDGLAERGTIAVIRLMPNSKRIPTLDAELYRQRNQIERIFSKALDYES